MKHVRISNCMRAVNGDKEMLHQLWLATKDMTGPYRIIRAPKTGDSDHYIIMDAA